MRRFWIILVMAALPGCAAAPKKDESAALRVQLAAVSGKFDLAKRENLNLKRELTLYRQYRDIDSKRFLRSADVLTAQMAPFIAKGDVLTSITDRGLVVVILSEQLFVSGSDVLSDQGKAFLDKIAALVDGWFPRDYIYIEGHTDNQSLAVFEWKSDWDFSFARALNVLKYFTENKKMDPLRFSASGFGQYRPRASNETREGRRLNRRIEIVIVPQRLKATVQTTGDL